MTRRRISVCVWLVETVVKTWAVTLLTGGSNMKFIPEWLFVETMGLYKAREASLANATPIIEYGDELLTCLPNPAGPQVTSTFKGVA